MNARTIHYYFLLIFTISSAYSHPSSRPTTVLIKPKIEILFAPDDDPVKQLITAIQQAKKRIYAAIYMISDKQIAESLINAFNNGIKIELVVDQLSTNKYGKAFSLMKAQIPVYVLPAPAASSHTFSTPLMHHKLAIIDDDVWCGSMNWTVAGNNKNQESVMITNDPLIRTKCEKQFEILKKRSILCQTPIDVYYAQNLDFFEKELTSVKRSIKKYLPLGRKIMRRVRNMRTA